MCKFSFQHLLTLAACAALWMGAGSADAGWRHRHGYWGSYSGGYWGGSSGYWGGSSGYWGGSSGYWGGSSGYWGGSSGYWGGSSGSGGYWGGPYPGRIITGSPSMRVPTYAGRTGQSTSGVAPARLVMNVPENATIYCMGKKTTTQGTTRRFVVPLATAGQEFEYPIKVEIARDGKTHSTDLRTKVESGKTVELTVTESAEGEVQVVQR